ncbi:MAG: hypothetical protein FWE35_10840 [Streptosporangiales bacterium]|nr:hypothetical protein [Streptosporangiales bacterium]
MAERRALTPDQHARMLAAVDLVGRTGAREFEIGFLHEDVPVSEAAWWASALYRGARVIVEDHSHPADAAEGLAVRLLTGARCRCGKLVALQPGGAFAFYKARLIDGSEFTAEDAQRAGQCRWTRIASRWVPGCAGGPAFTCPRCHKTSWNPGDVREGYCGRCHDWTGEAGS